MMNLIAVRDAIQSLNDLRGERGILIVDDDDAILTGRDADVSAGALEHVYRAGDLRDLDLDFAEILLREDGRGEARHRMNVRMGADCNGERASCPHASGILPDAHHRADDRRHETAGLRAGRPLSYEFAR